MNPPSTAPLPDVDREWIRSETFGRCLGHDMSIDQFNAAEALAVDLYETAARHGIDRTVDAVPSLISAAIDGILTRDRRH